MLKKNKFLRFTIVLLIILLLIPNLSNAANYIEREALISDNIIITVNGEKVPFKAALVDDRTYLPVRVIGYALNADVDWTHKTRRIDLNLKEERVKSKNFDDLISIGGIKKSLFVDDMNLYLNNKYYKDLSNKIMLIEERSYLPLRAISEQLGIRSTWNEETKTIEIVNPNIIQIDKDDSYYDEYYVKDLPVVKTNEDYLVGNWIGQNRFRDYSIDESYLCDSVLHISKADSTTYRIVYKLIITDDNISSESKLKKGDVFITENKNIFFNNNNNSIKLNRDKAESILVDSEISDVIGSNQEFQLIGENLIEMHILKDGKEAKYKRY